MIIEGMELTVKRRVHLRMVASGRGGVCPAVHSLRRMGLVNIKRAQPTLTAAGEELARKEWPELWEGAL
ncbi:MAG: hypothetical protein ACQES2_00590 [Pseudomonadota bacterium]